MRALSSGVAMGIAALLGFGSGGEAVDTPYVAAGSGIHTYGTDDDASCTGPGVFVVTLVPATREAFLGGESACGFTPDYYGPGQCAYSPGGAVACARQISTGARSELRIDAAGSLVYGYDYRGPTLEQVLATVTAAPTTTV